MARARKQQAKRTPSKRATPKSGVSFPRESAKYRSARNKLLRSEIKLRRQIEAVAAERRKLPLGGVIKDDYVFDSADGPVRISSLFEDGKDTLLVYSYMFGPQMAAPCVSCTSILDSLDGEAPHVVQRVNLAVVAKSPIDRILEFTRARGWRNLRLLSSAGNTYNLDYHGESDTGSQLPMMNVFVRHKGRIYHTYATELMFAPSDRGQDGRHVDSFWPLWNLFDLTPEGRGKSWYPRLRYD